MTRQSVRVLLSAVGTAALLGSVALVMSGSAGARSSVDAGTTGMYVGYNEGERFLEVEQQLGQPLAWAVAFTGSKSVDQMRSASWGQFESDDAFLPDLADRIDVSVQVPLAFGPGGESKTEAGRRRVGSNLRDTANGAWDDDFRVVAERLVAAGFPDAVIRLGHEFDGDWSPHSARENNAEYIAAFRHVHDVFESVSPGFRFDWTSMRAHFRNHGPEAYPGDAYVDIVGLDIYYRKSGELTDTVWENQYLPALVAHRDFARSHGKPVSYPEWGRAFGTSHRFVDLMHEWFAAIEPGGLVYQSYFNEKKADYDLDRNRPVKQRYLAKFGPEGSTSGGSQPPTTTTPTTTTTTAAPIVTTPPTTAAPVTTLPVDTQPATTVPAAPTTTPPAATTPPTTTPTTVPPETTPATGPPQGSTFAVEGSRFGPSIWVSTGAGTSLDIVVEHATARLFNIRHRAVGATRWIWDGQTRAVRSVIDGTDPATDYEVQVKAYVDGRWRAWNTVSTAGGGVPTEPIDAVEVPATDSAPMISVVRDGAVLLVDHEHIDARLFNVRYRSIDWDRWKWMGQTRNESTTIAPVDTDGRYIVEVKAYIDGGWGDWTAVEVD